MHAYMYSRSTCSLEEDFLERVVSTTYVLHPSVMNLLGYCPADSVTSGLSHGCPWVALALSVDPPGCTRNYEHHLLMQKFGLVYSSN